MPHTPGPLEPRILNGQWIVEFVGADHRWKIADVFGSTQPNHGEPMANAHLFASSTLMIDELARTQLDLSVIANNPIRPMGQDTMMAIKARDRLAKTITKVERGLVYPWVTKDESDLLGVAKFILTLLDLEAEEKGVHTPFCCNALRPDLRAAIAKAEGGPQLRK